MAFRDPRKKGGYKEISDAKIKELADLFPNIDYRGMLAAEKADSEHIIIQLCQPVGIIELTEFTDERGRGEE